jgi:AAA15 family ATPase/GTPase
MNKQQLPKIVAEVLKEISEKVKEFNKTSKLKLIAEVSLEEDNDEDAFFEIFPEGFQNELYFQISEYDISNLATDEIFTVYIDEGVLSKFDHNFDEQIDRLIKNVEVGEALSKIEIIELFGIYLDTVRNVFLPKIEQYSNISIDLHDLFNIEKDEVELTPEPNTFESKDKILPYSLKQLKVKDFQGINQEGTSIDDIPVDSQWIFLVGENGFGKTTILQSIFLGLNGVMDGSTNLLDDKNSSIQVEYKGLESSVINSIRDNKNPLIHLAAYGPGRLNLQGLNNENVEGNNNSLSYNLFKSDGFLFNINVVLKDSSLKKDGRFKLIKKAICTLIPNLSDVKYNQETDQIEYIEREINNDGENITYQPLPFKKLASGFKSIIALAGDMIVRLSKNQPEVKDPSELKGIVLIDEIDLHLHPKLQKQLIGQFSKVFPKIQFIVSTHSPIPLLGAESNSVILKVNRTEAKGIQVEHIKVDLKNLTPNLVLTSGIFDMEDFISVQNENINEVRTEDSMTEMEENDKVAKYLEEFEKSDEHFPDELFLPKTSK